MIGNNTLAHVSAKGSDTALNLWANTDPLESRIAGELRQRGLDPLSSAVTTSYSVLSPSSYSFVWSADVSSVDPNRQWTDTFLRQQIANAIQAATTYNAIVSIEARGNQSPPYVPPVVVGGGIVPGGSATGGDKPQSAPQSPNALGSILGFDPFKSVGDLLSGLDSTAKVLMIGVGVLVVGGVLFVLIKPGEAARAVRTVVR